MFKTRALSVFNSFKNVPWVFNFNRIGKRCISRQRQRNHHPKREFALFQTSSLLFQLFQFVKCWRIFQELNSKGLFLSSQKEKEYRCLVFTSSLKREIRHFHVVVPQWRQRNVQKSVLHVQSCCFAEWICCFLAVLIAVVVVVAYAP